jgi:TetR/AcrR family transcriptional regulator, transcriptional repressor for nem operon
MKAEPRTSTRPRRDPEGTRQALLEAAYNEIYRSGFRAASLDTILAAAGVTRGALYYHFGSKQELGYAVVDERVKPLIRERYIDPVRGAEDPTAALRRMGLRMERELLKTGILLLGCPVNNLVQEMSGVDEGFRERLAAILKEWKDAIADVLRRGQTRKLVRSDVDAEAVATFIVASYQGACGFAKSAHKIEPFTACRKSLDAHLKTLQMN